MKIFPWVFSTLTLVAIQANAQQMTRIAVDKPQVLVGQAVMVGVGLDAPDGAVNCGLVIHWGDGQSEDIKLFKPDQIPVVRQHVYDKPGSFTVTAEPRKVTSHLGCMGKPMTTAVQVLAVPAMTMPSVVQPPPASIPKTTGPCPEGWNLDAKSVNKKTGAFVCTAQVGARLPEKKLDCAGDSGYFENPKKGQIGCKP